MNSLDRKSTFFLLVLSFFCPVHDSRAQGAAPVGHEHMTATCVEVAPGTKRPEFGCFRIGVAKGLQFNEPAIYWHLWTFPKRASAEAARSAAGVVVEEEGQVWLAEFGAKDMARQGGKAMGVIGPLQLLPAKTYDAEIAYAVLRPGDRSRVHTHAGPEAWYVFAGEQCLETPKGVARAQSGQTMFVEPGIAMELSITGTGVRRAFAVVVHDSAQDWGAPSEWQPTGACGQ